eukprot:scaffold103017_cov44-Tisochrysis_lutea.AAC.1
MVDGHHARCVELSRYSPHILHAFDVAVAERLRVPSLLCVIYYYMFKVEVFIRVFEEGVRVWARHVLAVFVRKFDLACPRPRFPSWL